MRWYFYCLQISPREQVHFIKRLRKKALLISEEAQRKTIQILKQNSILDDWQLYGKTGGPVDSGWFVGWMEKNGRSISFAQYIEQPFESLLTGGRVAKEVVIDNLTALVLGSFNTM